MSDPVLVRLNQEQTIIRRKLIEEIQNKTKRKLVTYVANFGSPAGNIIHDDVLLLYDVLKSIEFPKELDILIHSPGGIVEAAEKFVSLLREHVTSFRVIIPDMAKSAATLISLSSDEILMSSIGELGPIDPQINIGVDPTTGQPIFRPAWSYLNSLDRLEDELIKNRRNPTIIIPLVGKIDPTLMDVARKAIVYSETLAQSWLEKYMKLNTEDAKRIAKHLADASLHLTHGRTIRYTDAKNIGLNVNKLDDTLWDLVHELYIRSRSVLRGNVAKIIESEKVSLAQNIQQQ